MFAIFAALLRQWSRVRAPQQVMQLLFCRCVDSCALALLLFYPLLYLNTITFYTFYTNTKPFPVFLGLVLFAPIHIVIP